MDIFDPDYINMRPIGGGQEPDDENAPPERIVVSAFATVWSEDTSSYADWVLSAYKPFCHAARIEWSSGGILTVYNAPTNEILQIVNIVIVVGDETDITFYVNGKSISGDFPLGGEGEPRGLVIPFAYAPLTAGHGAAFAVGSSQAVKVSGMLTYMLV